MNAIANLGSEPLSANEPKPTVVLTPEQIQFFHENGYLTIDSITTPEEVEFMRTAYDRIFDQKAAREEGNQFDLAGTDEEGKAASLPQILSPSLYAPELASTQARVNAEAICAQLLGGAVEFRGDHAILKLAGSGAPTPWHQDAAYWDPNKIHSSISIWIPLQPATVANGCMQFVPGSHHEDIVPHQSINNDPRIHGLETVEKTDESQAIVCELPAGGATFHGGYMLHATGANRSDAPRRAYIIGFGRPDKARETPRNFPWQDAKRTAREERYQAAQAAKN